MSLKFTNSQRLKLQSLNRSFNIPTEPLLQDSFHAHIQRIPHEIKRDNETIRLWDRTIHAFHSKGSDGRFYYALVYTQAQSKRKYGRNWNNCQYQKHFVSGRTFSEFLRKLQPVMKLPYD